MHLPRLLGGKSLLTFVTINLLHESKSDHIYVRAVRSKISVFIQIVLLEPPLPNIRARGLVIFKPTSSIGVEPIPNQALDRISATKT